MLEEVLNCETHMAAIRFAYVCLCAVMHGIELTPDRMTDWPNNMQTSQIPLVKRESYCTVHVIRIQGQLNLQMMNVNLSFSEMSPNINLVNPGIINTNTNIYIY